MLTETQRLNRKIDSYARAIAKIENAERATIERKKMRAEQRARQPIMPPIMPVVLDNSKLAAIMAEVSAKHGISVQDFMSPRRERRLASARHEAWWRAWNETQFSLPQIGRAYNRHHTSIIHGIRMHEKRMAGAPNGQN